MWRAVLIFLVLAVPAIAQTPDTRAKMPDTRTQQGYDACVRIMRSCGSMNPGVRKACPADGVPTVCPGIVQAWNAAHPFPGDNPPLPLVAKQACDQQAIANAANDSAASTQAGLKCTW